MSDRQLSAEARARNLARSGRGRDIRLAAGLSYTELAALAGVDRVSVYRWEHGLRVPSGDAAGRYGRVLACLDLGLS